MSIALLFGLMIVLGGMGYLFAVRILGETMTVARIGLATSFGVAFFLVLTNGLGFVVPGQRAFIVSSALCVALLIGLLFVRKKSLSIESAPRWWWMVAGTLSVLAGLASARILNSDLWTWGQTSVAATVMMGNLPIHEPINPWSMLGYHYGPQLLSGAWSYLTGLSVAGTYDVQPFLGMIGGICMAGALMFRMSKSWKVAIVAVVLTLGATGIQWVYGVRLLQDMWNVYVMGQAIDHPFRNATMLFTNSWVPSLFMLFQSRGYTLGFPLLFGLLYTLYEALQKAKIKDAVAWIVVGNIFMLALALTTESSMVLIAPAGVLTVLLLITCRKADPDWKQFLFVGLLLCVPSLLLSLVQGGVLTSAVHGSNLSIPSFVLNAGKLQYFVPNGAQVGFWEPEFLIGAGLPFVLFPIVLFVAWKRRADQPFVLFLALLALCHFLVPMLVRYAPRPNEMMRFFHMGETLSGFLLALLLAPLYQHPRRLIRVGIWLAIVCMILSSVLALIARLCFPTMRLERSPILAPMLPATAEQKQMYQWVLDHTTIHDYFFQRTQHADIFSDQRPEGSEEELQQRERILFMSYTGRYSIGYLHWGEMTQERQAAARDLDTTCSLDAAKQLSIRYFVVETAARAAWFKTHCEASAWKLVYDGGSSKVPFPRIYERLK